MSYPLVTGKAPFLSSQNVPGSNVCGSGWLISRQYQAFCLGTSHAFRKAKDSLGGVQRRFTHWV